MTAPRSDEHPLVRHLIKVAEEGDRATLAALRSSLREGNDLIALRVVLPFLKARASRKEEDAAVLLAGLFALHPESGQLSLAAALHRVWRDTGSESVEGRFRALLGAGGSDLAPHLRHAVSLVASKGVSLDWNDLYRTIRHWDDDDDWVRRRWARDFWGASDEPSNSPLEHEEPRS
jgi:CRISPR type I-E-associated protein CasB/Cse2